MEKGLGVVMTKIGHEQSEGAIDPGSLWNDEFWNIEFLGELHGMDRSCTAKADHRKIARIVASLHGDHPDPPDHCGIDHTDDSLSRLLQGKPHRFCHPSLNDLFRKLNLQFHLPTQKIVGIEIAEDDAGVGYRRFFSALAIA